MPLPTSFNELSPVTIHVHTGGNSTYSGGVYTASADQVGDWVFGVGELSNGSQFVVTGTGRLVGSFPYGGVSDVAVSIIDNGVVTTNSLSFAGANSPDTWQGNEFEVQAIPLSGGGMVIGESVSNGSGGNGNDYFEILDNAGAVTKSWTAFKSTSNADKQTITSSRSSRPLAAGF